MALTWHHTFGLGHLLWSLNPSSFCKLVRVITPFFLKSHHLWHLLPFLKSIFSQSTRSQTWILLKGSLFLDMLSTLKQNIMGCCEVTGNSFYTGVQMNGMLAIKIRFIEPEFCPPVSLMPFSQRPRYVQKWAFLDFLETRISMSTSSLLFLSYYPCLISPFFCPYWIFLLSFFFLMHKPKLVLFWSQRSAHSSHRSLFGAQGPRKTSAGRCKREGRCRLGSSDVGIGPAPEVWPTPESRTQIPCWVACWCQQTARRAPWCL